MNSPFPPHADAALRFIITQRKRQHITYKQLSSSSNVAMFTLAKLHRRRSIHIATARKILNALGYDLAIVPKEDR